MKIIGEAAAPAKINWALAVLFRRADGYHEIDTIMQMLNLTDNVRIKLSRERTQTKLCGRYAAGIETDDRNLASRAALLYAKEAKIKDQFSIELEKNIPSMAGLGGGSSDAAAVLKILEANYKALGEGALVDLAAKLGADVPFFLSSGAARCCGIGEKRTMMPARSFSVLVAMGDGGVSTAAVYERWRKFDVHPNQTTKEKKEKTEAVMAALQSGDINQLKKNIYNDLELPSIALQPQIGGLLEKIRKTGALAVQMSGSGAACFGLFEDEAQAQQAAKKIDANFIAVTSTRESA